MQKFKLLVVACTLLGVIAAPTLSTAETKAKSEACVGISDAEVIALFDRWNASLKTTNPDKVLENYADNAILLPTLSNTPRTNHAQLKDYFVTFLKKNPSGAIDQRVIRHGCDWATDSGIYTFTFKDDGEVEHVQARYSYAYEYINGKWLIVLHHSSLMPEASDKAAKEDREELSELEKGHD